MNIHFVAIWQLCQTAMRQAGLGSPAHVRFLGFHALHHTEPQQALHGGAENAGKPGQQEAERSRCKTSKAAHERRTRHDGLCETALAGTHYVLWCQRQQPQPENICLPREPSSVQVAQSPQSA